MDEERLQAIAQIIAELFTEDEDLDVDDLTNDEIIERVPARYLEDLDEEDIFDVIDEAKEEFIFE